MGREYQYDETGVFSFFVLSLLGLYLLPTTFSRIKGLFSSTSSTNPKNPLEELVFARRRLKQKSEKKSQLGLLIWLGAWALFIFLAYQASQFEHTEQVTWNPYEILDISTGANEAEIKLAYKKWSLIWHPDKNKGNEEEAERKFVDISKAYKVLTDEETRKNWELYGNPDGKQDVSMGIALPKWIAQTENMALVLGAYIFFLVLVVIFLGRWWAGSSNFSQKNAAQHTARLVALLQSKISEAGVKPFTIDEVFRELAFSPEFVETVTEDESEAKLLQDIAKDSDSWVVPPPKDVKPAIFKTFYFLNCHLKQVKVPAEFQKDYDFVVRRSVAVLQEILKQPARNFPIHSSCFSRIVELQQMLTQATWNPTPLLEEVHQSTKEVKSADADASKKKSKNKARAKGDKTEKTETSDKSTSSSENLEEVQEVSSPQQAETSQIPQIKITTAKLFVVDEDEIRVGDKLTLNLKIEITYNQANQGAKASSTKEDEEADFEELEKKRTRNVPSEVLPAYAPLFPEPRPSTWWVTLVDEKGFSIICDNLKELTSVDTIKNGTTLYWQTRFQWHKLGKCTFRVHVVSDCYLGLKASRTLEIDQKEPKLEPIEDDYEDDFDD